MHKDNRTRQRFAVIQHSIGRGYLVTRVLRALAAPHTKHSPAWKFDPQASQSFTGFLEPTSRSLLELYHLSQVVAEYSFMSSTVVESLYFDTSVSLFESFSPYISTRKPFASHPSGLVTKVGDYRAVQLMDMRGRIET